MSNPLIVLNRLRKVYRETVAVDGVSLAIPAGEIFGFLGANGAGKTTTIRMLCGLTRPDSGQARIDGFDVWANRYDVRSKIGYLAQKFSLYTDLTVTENLQFFGGAYRVAPARLKERIAVLLKQMDLEGKRDAMAGSLSGGMKQLLALGCALIHEPRALFLDEPTSGLDPVHRQQIWDLLYDLSHQGTTIFVTTHYMDEAERCTQVGFLHQGRLLAEASPSGLKRSFRGRLLELQVEPLMPALSRFRALPDVLGVAIRSGMVRLYAPEPEKLLARWQADWPFPEIAFQGFQWAEADMEDVFKAYSQGFTQLLEGGAL